MTLLLAIDPGPKESAFVLFDGKAIRVKGITTNESLLLRCRSLGALARDWMAIEDMQSFGKAVGAAVFTTCRWIGRFEEAFGSERVHLIKRMEVKMHLCHATVGVNDSVIRQRLIDIYGGKETAIGLKKTPGPLYGVKSHEWQALALAVVCMETRLKE